MCHRTQIHRLTDCVPHLFVLCSVQLHVCLVQLCWTDDLFGQKNCISYYSSNTTIFHISLMAVCQIMVEFQHQPPASYLNIRKSYIKNMGKITQSLNLSSISFVYAKAYTLYKLWQSCTVSSLYVV